LFHERINNPQIFLKDALNTIALQHKLMDFGLELGLDISMAEVMDIYDTILNNNNTCTIWTQWKYSLFLLKLQIIIAPYNNSTNYKL
jgi:hypothetical protein